MSTDNGIQIALSPIQLAAILTNASVSEGEIMTNRLWGGVSLLGGVLELFGAGVLCLTPEPTALSKVGCVVMGVHGLDTISAGTRQIISSQQTNTSTYQLAQSIAQQAGAHQKTAQNIALSIDLAVPIAFSALYGASRISAIRSGRIKLIEHEAIAGSKAGGHTLAIHVGKTEQELLQRLASTQKQAKYRPSAASSFHNLDIAEKAITEVIRANQPQIQAWLKSMPTLRLTLERSMNAPVGILIKRGSTTAVSSNRVRVVLKGEVYNGKPYFILTAFPI